MQSKVNPIAQNWQQPAWVALLVAASVAFSLGFACAVPFAAFAAASTLTLPRRAAFALVGLTWLVNQAVGFGVLHYPWTAECAAWGLCLGAISLAATLGADFIVARTGKVAWAASFLAAFVIYEGSLFAVSLAVHSSMAAFAPAVVVRIFAINAVAFAGLLVIGKLAEAIGLKREGHAGLASIHLAN
jgi:hypothetical protein